MKALARLGLRPFCLGLTFGASVCLGSVAAGPVRLTASQASVDALGDYLIGLGDQPAWWDVNGDQQCDVADIVSLINTSLGLSIQNLTWEYSTPYLLDFTFTLRDQNDHAVQVPPKVFQVQALEDGQPISRTETGYQLVGATGKQMRSMLVLDYTNSMAEVATNGDSDGDGLSDSIEAMQEACKVFFESVNEDAQVGIVEFHNDFDPEIVAEFTNNHEHLSAEVDRIWTEVVQMNPGETHVWDAVYRALEKFRVENVADEQRFIIFLTDGDDTSSIHRPDSVIALARSRGVRLYSVGFGVDLKPDQIEPVTAATEGRYYEAGASPAELRGKFEEIIRDLGGQYTLRWATLRRTPDPFSPSFEVSLSGNAVSAEAGAPHIPTEHAGNVRRGVLRFVGSPVVDRTTTVYLRADYVPRNVRHIRLRLRSDHPFRVQRVPAFSGGLIEDWTVTTTYLGSSEHEIDMVSPNPLNISTAIPFASFGPLLRFQFMDLPSLDALFARPDDVRVDNSLYATTGKQSFVISNVRPVFNRNLWERDYDGAEEVVVSDIDGDRWPDIVGAAANLGVVTHWRSGDCIPYQRRDLGGGIGLNGLMVLGSDLLAVSPSQQSFILYGIDDPRNRITCEDLRRVDRWVRYPAPTGDMPGALLAGPADVDHDGDIDYVGASSTTGALFWRERRDDPPNGVIFGVRTIDSGFSGVSTVVTTNFGAGNAVDVVAGSALTGEICLWRLNPITEVWNRTTLATGFTGINQIRPLDLDGDGDMDLLGISPSLGQVAWWENNGQTVFTTRVIDNGAAGVETIHFGDYDGDRDVDLVACSRSGNTIWVYENDGFQTFERLVVVSDYQEPSCVFFADSDLDGDLDIWATSVAPFEDNLVYFRTDRVFQW
jgi:hypothetical protein